MILHESMFCMIAWFKAFHKTVNCIIFEKAWTVSFWKHDLYCLIACFKRFIKLWFSVYAGSGYNMKENQFYGFTPGCDRFGIYIKHELFTFEKVWFKWKTWIVWVDTLLLEMIYCLLLEKVRFKLKAWIVWFRYAFTWNDLPHLRVGNCRFDLVGNVIYDLHRSPF